MKNDRRDFLKLAGLTGLGVAGAGMLKGNSSGDASQTAPGHDQHFMDLEQKHVQQFNMSGFAAPKIKIVGVGIVGLGNRGPGHLRNLSKLKGVEIKALCDLQTEKVEKAKMLLEGTGHTPTLYSGHEDAWKKLCDRDDIHLVIITTPWTMHAKMAVYAMKQGKHVASEVALASTIQDCWQVVETAERTHKHCFMMANYCYNNFELTILNMARKGFFGELVHAEGGYIDNKIANNFSKSKYWDMWWLKQYANRKGNIYPIHGFEIICQMMDINRGDKLNRLVSIESEDFIMGNMAKELASKDDLYEEFAEKDFRGNINTSVIKTARGRTIVVQHDASTYRPFTLKQHIYGMNASVEGYPAPARIYLREGGYIPQEKYKTLMEEYKPGFLKKTDLLGKDSGSEFRSDALLMWRLIDCLHNGWALDMDVYDGAAMSSVLPLSEWSVTNGSQPIDFPDFTAGAWKTNKQNMGIIN